MKRRYVVGGVEFVQEAERLMFRLSWRTLLFQSAIYLLLIPFIAYALALPLLEAAHAGRLPAQPGALWIGLFVEIVLLSFLIGRIMDRIRPYSLDLRDRTLRHGAVRLGALEEILTVGVVQRNRAYGLEFTLRPDSRTIPALRLSSLKGASDAVKEVARFLGMET